MFAAKPVAGDYSSSEGNARVGTDFSKGGNPQDPLPRRNKFGDSKLRGGRMMKRRFSLSGVVLLAAVWLLPASLRAENFVFTNNDLYGANSVTTFSVDPSTFALTNLGTTPTGGTTCSGDLYLRSIIASPDGNYLYVANGGSADISTFRINKTTGELTAVGTPVATGNYAGCASGGASAALAMTQQGNILFAANRGTNTISTYRVARDGKLTMVGSPMAMPGTPISVAVRPPDEFLAVGLFVPPDDNSAVAMFRIGHRGELTAVPDSRFAFRRRRRGHSIGLRLRLQASVRRAA
jgi:hypothetical protein